MTVCDGYLAFDLGAESGRAVVGTLSHGRIALAEVHRFPHEPVQLPSGLHWDITGLWQQICVGLRRAARWATGNGVHIHSIGVDTWGVDWALIGKSGELLGIPHAYRDPRNVSAFQSVVDELGVDEIYRTTGNQLLPLNTLYSLYAHSRQGREILAAADKLLFLPDLFHYWLCGRVVIEATVASTSQMIDCRSGDWAYGLLERLGIPQNILAPISPPCTTVGPLRSELIADSGLPKTVTVIAPAAHDTASAVAAAPATDKSDWCYLSSGTWSLLGCELREPCMNAAAQREMFTNELGVGGKTRFLKVIPGLWLVQQCRKTLILQGLEFSYSELAAQASEAEAFRTIINPTDPVFQSAGDMLKQIRAFATSTGQLPPDTPGQYIRCCLESLAILYRQTHVGLESALNCRFPVMHILGGGGHNKTLNQMAADATNCAVQVGPFEATAVGNLLTQAIALGHVGDIIELRRIVANSFVLESYEPAAPDPWKIAADRYCNLIPSG